MLAFTDKAAGPLDPFFNPRSIALIGASETPHSVGHTLMANLVSHPAGAAVFPINPKREQVLGIKAYPSIGALGQRVDLAIIATPAATVPGLVQECAAAGVKHLIILSAGFKETGEKGQELEARIKSLVQAHGMRVIGPNCLGVISPVNGLNATFARGMAQAGNLAFLSQSGALLTCVIDWSHQAGVGFSGCVSLGSMLDVSWADLIEHFGDDPATKAILIYMETIGDAQAFISAARRVCGKKPLVVLKAGRSEAAARAAASHTGALTGSDEVLDAVFEHAGLLRAESIQEFFDLAQLLCTQPMPQGPRLAMITNAGGPAVLATDALCSWGGQLAPLCKASLEKLKQFLPPSWSHNNPIDILGDADSKRYEQTLQVAANDSNNDALLLVLTPQDMTEPTQTAQVVASYATQFRKPLLASWMGGQMTAEGIELLRRAGVATFATPDAAAKAFGRLWLYHARLKQQLSQPETAEPGAHKSPAEVSQIIEAARAQQRSLLTEFESKRILGSYGLPVGPILLATSAQQAVEQARALGFPAVLKLHSHSISHKSDIGGVQLNLANEQQVQEAFCTIESNTSRLAGPERFQGVTVQPMVTLKDSYELIIGSSSDPQCGPVVMFGSGGQLVEVYRDYALSMPLESQAAARRLIQKTKICKALEGVRGRRPVNFNQLEQLLVLFSRLVREQPAIREIDINPLLINDSGMILLDARIVLLDR